MGDLQKSNVAGLGGAVGFVAVVLILVVVGVVVWKYSAPTHAPATPSQLAAPNKEAMLPPEETVRVAPAIGHAESTLELTPERTSVEPNQRFEVQVTVQPGNNRVSGAELRFKYDPKMVKLEAIQASPVFSLELQAAKIDNTEGAASIALGTALSESSLTTKQTVATLVFSAAGSEGISRIEITDKSLVSADNEAQNVLKAIKSAQVSIAAK